jgi:hypothetical protein
MLVSLASGVSTKMSLFFQTSFNIPFSRSADIRDIRAKNMTNHVVPCRDNRLHIKVAGEESDNPVWNDLTVIDQDASEVANYSRIVPNFKARTNCYLVTPTSNNLIQSVQIGCFFESQELALQGEGKHCGLVS